MSDWRVMMTFNNWVAEKIQKQWEDTGLLNHIPEERKATVAKCLEGQRLHNESSDTPHFNRISIPIVLRLLAGLPEVNGSSSPLPENHVFDVHFHANSQYDGHGGHDINQEAKETAELAGKLADEIRELAEGKQLTIYSFSNKENGQISMNYSLEPATS